MEDCSQRVRRTVLSPYEMIRPIRTRRFARQRLARRSSAFQLLALFERHSRPQECLLWVRAEVLTASPDFRVCEGFRMTAHRDDSACTGAVVRKPPVKERAGDEVRTLRRALWRFDRGVDGGREARERGDQVMTGADGSRALFSTGEAGFRSGLRCGKRCRAVVRSSVAVAGV